MQSKKSLHPGFFVTIIPSNADQVLSDVRVSMFELSMGHAAPPTHCPSPVGKNSTRPISPRHRAPPCCRPSTTLRQAEELHRRALTGREDQLGPVHPSTLDSVWYLAVLLETKGSFAEAMGISVGSRRCLGRFCLDQGNVASRVSVLMAWCAGNHFTIPSLSSVHHRHNHPHHGEPGVATRCY